MIVIAKNKKDNTNHLFLNVDKIEFLDSFYNDKDIAMLSKVEEIYENGSSRSKGKLLNSEYKIILIDKDSNEDIEIIEELAQKNNFVIHRDFI